MSEKECFAPGIIGKYGDYHQPKGWEWILGFAVGGCDWAIKEASKPGFREMILEDLKQSRKENIQKQINDCFEKIARLKEDLRILE